MLPTIADSNVQDDLKLFNLLEELALFDNFRINVDSRARSRLSRAAGQYFNQLGLVSHVDHDTSVLIVSKDQKEYSRSRSVPKPGMVAVVPPLTGSGAAVAFMDANGATMIISVTGEAAAAKEGWIVEFLDIHKTPGPNVVPMYFCQGYTAIARVLAQGFTPTLKARADWDPSKYDFKTPYRVVIGSNIDIEIEE